MAKLAAIFPGQGSQYVGMGKDIFEEFAVAREAFEIATDVVGFDLKEVCFEGPEEKLRETRFTQLAILTHSVAIWRLVEAEGLRPEFVAGHSVGEYSALVAAGALSFTDALRLVKIRAEAMYSAGVEKPGAMAALIGMPEENVDGLLEAARQSGIVAAANYNSPVQLVISGDVAAVEKAVEAARSYGAKRCIRLNVSGAFHSPLMKTASDRLADALRSVSFSRAGIPVVANVTAAKVTEPEEIADLLERQLTSPVLWHQSMAYLTDQGIGSFVELGPGSVLCGLLKRINPQAGCVSCSDADSVREFLQEVSA